jgi:hypothetical protein
MAAKLTRLTHKIAIQLHLVAESWTICSSRSRQPVRKLLDTPSCTSIPPYVLIACVKHRGSFNLPASSVLSCFLRWSSFDKIEKISLWTSCKVGLTLPLCVNFMNSQRTHEVVFAINFADWLVSLLGFITTCFNMRWVPHPTNEEGTAHFHRNPIIEMLRVSVCLSVPLLIKLSQLTSQTLTNFNEIRYEQHATENPHIFVLTED